MNDRPGPHDPDRPDDEAARRLREVLANEARAITPSGDGLVRIREQLAARRHARHSWLRPLSVAAAAMATAAVAVVVVVNVRPHAAHNTGQVGAASPTTTPQQPTPAASTPGTSASPTYPVWVFYVGKLADPQQLLYREQVTRQKPAGNAFIRDAVTAMLATPPADPDYTSYWPAGTTVVGASISGDTTAVIDLSPEAASGPHGRGTISAQQLLYTIQAAAPKITALELRIDGQPVSSLWGSQLAEPITAQPTSDIWAHVWLTAPAEHATVASSFTFGGEATVFEGTVSWQIEQHGYVLRKGSAQASVGGPQRGTWSQTVTLAPGTYTIKAFETSAKDGSQTYVDDKEITVS